MNKRIGKQMPSEQEQRLKLEEAQQTLLKRNEELAAAETLAHTILDEASEAIVVCSPGGQIVVANQVAQQLSGTSPVHQSFLQVFPLRLGPGELPWHGVERRQAPRLGPAVSLDLICNGKPVESVEVNLPRPDGAKFQLLLSAGPLLGARGEPLGCIITLTDITSLRQAQAQAHLLQERLSKAFQASSDKLDLKVQERTAELSETNQVLETEIAERRRVEEELRHSRALFESLLESAPDAIIAVDDAGRIVLVNSQTDEMFGYRREELLGQTIELLLPARFRDVHVAHRTKYNRAPSTRPKGVGLDLWGRRKDGTEFPVDISLSPAQTENGTLIVSIIRDITERKRAEEQLRLSEARFRTLVEQVHDYAIFGLDSQGYVISWNDGAERLNRYRAEEIIGKHYSIFFTAEDIRQGKPERELRDAAAKGQYEEEALRVRKDGTQYWADVVITALRDPQGNLRGFSKVIRDITARKETQEQIRQLNVELERRVQELATVNQELEAFSYSVSHDLRAPLRAIAGFSQALAEDYDATLDEQGKDYTRRINAATQRLTQLIDDLLMLSRVTRSEMNRETAVDLSAEANSIASQLRSAQPDRRVQFAVQPDLTTHGDAHLLHIALDNLIGNAWKFTSKTPDARIEFGTAGREDGKTVYFVRDNGAGFDMAFASKLFGPFQRLHSGNEFPGTGIGLATVQRIVHRHGGRVWAEGEVGKGAAVYFTL